MKLISQDVLDRYYRNDIIQERMNSLSQPNDENMTCQKWLRESLPKRYVFQQLYGDLFSGERKRVLDVGGGLTCFTRALAKRHDYFLIDILAHDNPDSAESMERSVGKKFIYSADWYACKSFDEKKYDLVIANDIFPNVDQRLELFLERYLSQCRCLRASLTWYNQPRFYFTKRSDGDEMFCMLAWDGKHLKSVLEKFAQHLNNPSFEMLSTTQKSVYANGRQVSIVEFVGEFDQ